MPLADSVVAVEVAAALAPEPPPPAVATAAAVKEPVRESHEGVKLHLERNAKGLNLWAALGVSDEEGQARADESRACDAAGGCAAWSASAAAVQYRGGRVLLALAASSACTRRCRWRSPQALAHARQALIIPSA